MLLPLQLHAPRRHTAHPFSYRISSQLPTPTSTHSYKDYETGSGIGRKSSHGDCGGVKQVGSKAEARGDDARRERERERHVAHGRTDRESVTA